MNKLAAPLCTLIILSACTDYAHEDKLCVTIAGAPSLSVPPKDRLWFTENCDCPGGVTSANAAECARIGSERHKQQRAHAEERARLRLARAQAEEAAAKMRREADPSQEPALRDAYLTCLRARPQGSAAPCREQGDPWLYSCMACAAERSCVDLQYSMWSQAEADHSKSPCVTRN